MRHHQLDGRGCNRVNQALRLQQSGTAQDVPGMCDYNVAARTLIFQLLHPLMPATRYTVRLPAEAFSSGAMGAWVVL